MYFTTPVKIPREKGKIIFKKKGSSTYILFQYGQIYNPEKRYAVPQRAIIGKVVPDYPEQMFPNERFQEFFPNISVNDELEEAYRSCALRIGSYAVIKKVLDEYNLPHLLSKWIPNDCGLALDLLAYLIVDEDNAGQYYPDFAFSHPLFSENMRIYSDIKVSRFLKSITKDQIFGFLDDWNKTRDHKQRVYISYDSTNKNCQAGDIDIIEYGKAKDEKGLPIFNLSIAYDKTNRIPLFYEEYPGSITDVSQFKYMVDKVIQYGYENVGFILDRGYFCKDNIQYMDDHNYAFVIMVKGQKELVSTLITENRNTFETRRDCNIRSYRVYGKTVKAKLYEDDKQERYFHIYFNPSKQAAEREQLEKQLDRMKQYLDNHIGDQITFGKTYQSYYTLRYNKKKQLVSYHEREAEIQKMLELCGYFCIVTSEEMTAAQALIQYKGRDISEKLFQSEKTFLGSRSMRVHSGDSLSGKIFLEFLALIVRNRIYNLLKETMLNLDAKPNYMTVPAAIRELEKIEMVRRGNGRYKLDHAVSKRQKIILSSFGMDADSISDLASEIETLLANKQSMMELSTDEEDTYGEDTYDIFD